MIVIPVTPSSVRASFKATKRLWLKIITTFVSFAPEPFPEIVVSDCGKCSTGTDFSTDTGAVLRAIEIEADAMLLAKAIDGIYDSDPKVNPQAKKYNEISIQEIIDKKLMAVDLTASIMCLENKMPMLVFGLNEPNSIVETMSGTFTGTKVTV